MIKLNWKNLTKQFVSERYSWVTDVFVSASSMFWITGFFYLLFPKQIEIKTRIQHCNPQCSYSCTVESVNYNILKVFSTESLSSSTNQVLHMGLRGLFLLIAPFAIYLLLKVLGHFYRPFKKYWARVAAIAITVIVSIPVLYFGLRSVYNFLFFSS